MVSQPICICQFVLCMVIISSISILYHINITISSKAVANLFMQILQDTNICSLLFTLHPALSRTVTSKDVIGNNVATTPISDNVASAVFMQD